MAHSRRKIVIILSVEEGTITIRLHLLSIQLQVKVSQRKREEERNEKITIIKNIPEKYCHGHSEAPV